uniref:Uncharacterized protein n=1 Tax=Picea glauca TaxID=3330 RepID=A0A101M0E2_PICGL|nr:hypothetical protein ABT39_MTgene4615 [Picea glauca]
MLTEGKPNTQQALKHTQQYIQMQEIDGLFSRCRAYLLLFLGWLDCHEGHIYRSI